MGLQTISGCVIAAGESLSNEVDCSGNIRLVRIIMPDEWTMAPLTFQLSPDGDEFHDLHNLVTPPAADAYRGYEVVVPNARAGSTITLPTDVGNGINWIKVRSGTLAAPVAQPVECEFSFVIKVPDAVVAPRKAA